MKKVLATVLLVSSISLTNGITALAATQDNTNNNVVSVGEQTKQSNLLTYTNAANLLSSISNDKATEFDKPNATDNGILLRMDSTTIQTKYGKMQVEQENQGYKVTNLSNTKAPILKVGVVNNIYEIGSQVDLKGLVSPVVYNSSGQEIKANVVFPNIDTSKAGYGETYIEANDGNGNITIAPFIYNVVQFKSSINVPTGFNVQNLSVQDILSGGEGNLRSYVAHYDKNSGKIIVGVSRGVASIRKEVSITFGNQTNNAGQQSEVAPAPKKEVVQPQKTNISEYNIPLAMRVFISPITYIVIGIILIGLIWFLCF